MGVTTDGNYDVISSATAYTGFHVKDIPSFVVYGTEANGSKAITGMKLGREVRSYDAAAYAEAAILKAAGAEITADQEAMLETALKTNPTVAPDSEIHSVKLASAEYSAPARYCISTSSTAD